MSGPLLILCLTSVGFQDGPPPVPADDPFLELPVRTVRAVPDPEYDTVAGLPPRPTFVPAPSPATTTVGRRRWWQPGFGAERSARAAGSHQDDVHECPDDCRGECPCDRLAGLKSHHCGSACAMLGHCTCRRPSHSRPVAPIRAPPPVGTPAPWPPQYPIQYIYRPMSYSVMRPTCSGPGCVARPSWWR